VLTNIEIENFRCIERADLDLQAALRPLADAYLQDLAASETLLDTTCSTDHCAFLLRGVPTLNLLTGRTTYEQIIHRTSDTLDKVNGIDLRLGAAVVAVTAYVLAQHPQPIARHLRPEGVERVITKAELLDGLSWLGRWPPRDAAR
jgi:Zn-dependent M28 family amino/carboxypeptidase